MNINRTKLALRKHSIRTLTASELRVAHGGKPGGTVHGPRPTTTGGTCIPKPRTVTKPLA